MKTPAPPAPATTLQIALGYLRAGLGVIPVRADGSKAPDLPKGHPYLYERPTEADLKRWFASGGRGIAVPCGKVSGNLETLDFETVAVYRAWSELVDAQIPGLAGRLCWVKTPGHYGQRGMHGRYRCPHVVIPGSTDLARDTERGEDGQAVLDERTGKPKSWLMIETRGEGSYAVAPGSPPACHETGRLWEHVSGPELTELPELTATERDILLSSARALNAWVEEADLLAEKARPPQSVGLLPGEDYNQRGPDWADVLGPAWVCVRTWGEVRYWRRPGKNGPGWSATTGYCKAEGVDLLHVFSGNCAPFAQSRSYSKFRAYVLLHHNGNYKAAAIALAREGYGEQRVNGHHANGVNGKATGKVPAEVKPEAELVLPEPPPWPEPPSDLAYQGLAGEIVRQIEPETESDPIAILVQLLTMFGSACARKRYWCVEDTRHHGNLFTCLVGPSAKGRKGTAAARAYRAFDHLECGWHDRVLSGLSSGEGLIKALRDEVWEKHKTKRDGKTEESEVLVDAGVKDKRLLCLEPEFGRVLRAMQREGNTLSALLRQGWDSDRMASLTKNGLTATGVHLSVIAHVTRSELLQLIDALGTDNGMGNRFLWFAVKRSKLLPFGGAKIDLAQKAHKLALAVEEAQRGPTEEVPFDDKASQLWKEGGTYKKLTAEQPGIIGAVTGRAEAQVRRLALLYALLDFSPVVAERHLLAALALWDYSERSVRWIFGESTGDRVADEILVALNTAGTEGMTQNAVRDLFNRNESSSRIAQALALLKDAGLIRSELKKTGDGPGRPATRWTIAERA